jgi:anti-sigma factor NepR-like protein
MNDDQKPTGPKGPMADSMQGSAHKRKSSLNRDTLIKIGLQLQGPYNDVVNQGVPDRFVTLLHRLQSGEIPAGSNGDSRGEESATEESAPEDKGS